MWTGSIPYRLQGFADFPHIFANYRIRGLQLVSVLKMPQSVFVFALAAAKQPKIVMRNGEFRILFDRRQKGYPRTKHIAGIEQVCAPPIKSLAAQHVQHSTKCAFNYS
jgi:hypothetical protein